MANCPVCNSKKGKRKCLIVSGFVCSLCCGSTRKEDLCSGCSFYQKPKRKYSDMPAYTTAEMDDNRELADYSNVIEGALCAYDVVNKGTLNDENAIKIVELLIDKYYFGDNKLDCDNQFIFNGVQYVEEAINKDIPEINKEIIVKILGVIRFVAKRRTRTGREYMNIVHQYVGQRIDTGIRILPKFDNA